MACLPVPDMAHAQQILPVQVRLQVADTLLGGRAVLQAARSCLGDGRHGSPEAALRLLLHCCQESPALCEAACVAGLPAVSIHLLTASLSARTYSLDPTWQ